MSRHRSLPDYVRQPTNTRGLSLTSPPRRHQVQPSDWEWYPSDGLDNGFRPGCTSRAECQVNAADDGEDLGFAGFYLSSYRTLGFAGFYVYVLPFAFPYYGVDGAHARQLTDESESAESQLSAS